MAVVGTALVGEVAAGNIPPIEVRPTAATRRDEPADEDVRQVRHEIPFEKPDGLAYGPLVPRGRLKPGRGLGLPIATTTPNVAAVDKMFPQVRGLAGLGKPYGASASPFSPCSYLA